MKQRVVKEKKFLNRVYRSKDLKPVEEGTLDQLRSLLAAVHLVINKRVPLTKKIAEEFLKLKKKTIDDLKKTFKSPEDILKLFKLSRADITKIIQKYFAQIKLALAPYFNKHKKEDDNLLT